MHLRLMGLRYYNCAWICSFQEVSQTQGLNFKNYILVLEFGKLQLGAITLLVGIGQGQIGEIGSLLEGKDEIETARIIFLFL